tara:strand:- start:5019 stop:5930 length:912 start_codon:yes stop_codon:yes gene_type:complete
MERIPFGNTGLKVTRLGVGLAEIGDFDLSSDDLKTGETLLNSALDAGINLLDTSACYGNSEEVIGRTVAHRRNEYILASKCGHVTGGYQGAEWTAETVEHSIDRSLKRLRTDHIDLMQLHSCGVDVMDKGEVVDALDKAKDSGKIRFVSYSGDNEEAMRAVESGRFDTLQTSLNIVDQHGRTKGLLKNASDRGMGIIIKRPIANSVWRADSSKTSYSDEYFERAQKMAAQGPIENEPDDRITTSLRFVFSHPEPHTIIVGTGNPKHMNHNINIVNEGAELPKSVLSAFHQRFDALGTDWRQLT